MDNGIISSFSVFVFICHYGKETKENIASLLYQRFTTEQIDSFLDFKSLNLGENIPKTIREVILKCTTAIILFSPGFCSSENCLNEVLMILEEKKPFIPIFWDIFPSELEAALEDKKDRFPENYMVNYRAAIKKVTDIAGIVFQSNKHDWAKLLDDIVNGVKKMNAKLRGEDVGKKNPSMHSFIKSNL